MDFDFQLEIKEPRIIKKKYNRKTILSFVKKIKKL